MPYVEPNKDGTRRYSPDTRTWTDALGTDWYICDYCDAAVDEFHVFIATVQAWRTDEAGAWYCPMCAKNIAHKWAKRFAVQETVTAP